MTLLNILVFPCGSEVALEIYRSLRYSRHVKLFGANSVPDHGRFIFENYVGDVPFVDSADFIPHLRTLIDKLKIDAIYPATDAVITKLKEYEDKLGCKVIASSQETTNICLSKSKTYSKLEGIIPIPKVYKDKAEITEFPVFMKPDIGYGSRGAKKINNREELDVHAKEYPSCITLEYLPGKEYTIDCFTDRNGDLLFSGARQRSRISNGISVNTQPVSDTCFHILAQKLNANICFRGAWFFQMKEDINGNLTLLEIASRLGGSSALYRNKGINFALLSIFDAFDYNLGIIENNYNIELDRALDNCYKISINYKEVYIDFDDCLIVNDKINIQLLAFIFQCINKKKKIFLITKHNKDIKNSLKQYRLKNIFDDVIHIEQSDKKYKYIRSQSAIFIDDSFAERKEAHDQLGIPVFSPDMVESLIEK